LAGELDVEVEVDRTGKVEKGRTEVERSRASEGGIMLVVLS
jgi:hypothetical protein